MNLRFGTDGWRGIIADDFTFENVEKVSQAIADYIKSKHQKDCMMVVGYDTRFLSDRFARHVACVFAANGIRVYLTSKASPTPAVSFAIKSKHADGGVMVTASHNPPAFNGLKFKAEYAGSASAEMTSGIESLFKRNLFLKRHPFKMDFEGAISQGLVKWFEPKPDYLKQITKLINSNTISKNSLRIVIDPMYGAANGYIRSILEEAGLSVIEIRSQYNPSFGGINPEPIESNLQALSSAVISHQAAVGLATDCDGDRIGVVDSEGKFVNPHQIFALLLSHLIENRRWSGNVAKTISTTRMIDILCEKFKLNLYETPIGFKHICDLMLEDNVLIGGEESGGIGIKGHIPERDGILASLLLVELLATERKTLKQLLIELKHKVGPFYYERRDIRISEDAKEKWITEFLLDEPPRINGMRVKSIDRRDGVKYLLDDGSWLMLRASGTEPVIRIYAEAKTLEDTRQLLEDGYIALASFME